MIHFDAVLILLRVLRLRQGIQAESSYKTYGCHPLVVSAVTVVCCSSKWKSKSANLTLQLISKSKYADFFQNA